jgi:integrase
MYGDGRIYLRGGTYWIGFNRYGEEVRMSARTDKKSEARKVLRRELAKSRTDAWIDPQSRKVTIGELVADLQKHYEAERMAESAANVQRRWSLHLKATFEHVPAHSLTTTMLSEYKAKRLAEEDKPAVATVQRELQMLRRAFNLAAESEPPKVARVPKFRFTDEQEFAVKEFFTPEQVDKLRIAADAEGLEWRALVELAYALGWRRGELLGLLVGDFDLLTGTLRIPTSKNGEPREVVISERLKMFVQPLLVGRAAEDKVFSFDKEQFRYPWKRIRKAAGVKKFHSWRRTAARDKRAAGVDSSVIMREQGWKTDAIFRRYAIVDRRDMAESQRALEKFQDETRTKVGQFEDVAMKPKEQVQ